MPSPKKELPNHAGGLYEVEITIGKDNTYDGTYRNPVEHHLIPYFGDAKMDNIRPVDIQSFF